MRSILGWGNATCTNGQVAVSFDVFRSRRIAADTSRVIADADRSLSNFLVSVLDSGTSVTFETPSDEWAKAVKRPAVSCFLHRVVEDIARRNADWADERNADGRVGGRQPPVRHYQLHYQVSAWAKSVEDEHRLLGRVMEACLAGEIVAAEHLAGVFEGEQQPLLVRLGVPVQRSRPAAPRRVVVVGRAAARLAGADAGRPVAPVAVHRHRSTGARS